MRSSPPFAYGEPVDALIRGLKFHGSLAHARILGLLLADARRPIGALPDVVVPVQLARGRFAERGFNQAAEIARHAARQVAPLAEIHQAVGGAAIAHLVDQAAERDVVARAQRAVFVHQELRHDKQADAFAAGRRIGQARQHQMDDVLDKIMVARADENFVTAQAVSAIWLWHCFRSQ